MNNPSYDFSLQDQDLKIAERVILETDPIIISKITEQVIIPIKNLITPKKISRKGNTPRPQNSFVIYRRDFMAKLGGKYGPRLSSDLPYVSTNASKWWKYEDPDVKNIYREMAKMAKKVHKLTFPDYKFKPKKKRTTFKHDLQPQNYMYPPYPPSPPPSLFDFRTSVSNGPSGPSSPQAILPPPIHSDNYDRHICRSFNGPY